VGHERADEETTWKPTEADGSDQAGSARVPCLTILSHPDLSRAGERAFLWPLARGGSVSLARGQLAFAAPGEAFGRPLADPFISRKPILFSRGDAAVRLAVPPGTMLKVDGRLVDGICELRPEALVEGVALALENRVCLLLHEADAGAAPDADDLGMVGDSDAMAGVRQAIRRVAELDAPVLVRGETGTGKELAAQALHRLSRRAARPFVSVSLAAIPQSLAAAELFGAAKGAFTGAAAAQPGYFRQAHGGTLFLDEIGEASPETQALLLRALETGEIHALGRQSPVKVDVRLIAATDADLDALMARGAFKAPLLHRLAGFEIHLPPLRRRREDLGRLFLHFARETLRELGALSRLEPATPRAPVWLPADLCAALVRQSWPGNVRQFRNAVRQLIVESRDRPVLAPNERLAEMLSGTAASDALSASPKPSFEAPSVATPVRRRPGDVAEAEVRAALRDCGWEIKAAARQLGLARGSLYDLIQKYRIPTALDLDAAAIVASHRRHDGDLDAMAQELAVSRQGLKRRLKTLDLDT